MSKSLAHLGYYYCSEATRSKAPRRRESLFDHAFMSLLVIRGSQDRNLEAGADAEALEKGWIPCILQNLGIPPHIIAWTLRHQSLVKKVPYGPAYFVSGGSLLPGDSWLVSRDINYPAQSFRVLFLRIPVSRFHSRESSL